MYRYSVDNAVTYAPEDLELFRVSPFAAWMERLTLENPGHGIAPDVDGEPPGSAQQRQDDVAQMLRAEGRQVCLVDWEHDEPSRRAATLEAMREGVDFIVNGQLALGPLSGACNLLMRSSGYSELGSYLYLPCDTQARTTESSAFRLCFLADLLHSLQGQLPPRLLIIRGGSDLLPLQTEDHVYYFRAIKRRFMQSMRTFRKHRMPDPGESSRFGRWSDCAHEVLKQRAIADEDLAEDIPGQSEQPINLGQAVAAVANGDSAYDLDDGPGPIAPFSPATVTARGDVGATLAEQALQLDPGVFAAESARQKPGSTPNLARLPERHSEIKGSTKRRQDEERRHNVPGHDVSPGDDGKATQGVLHTLQFTEDSAVRKPGPELAASAQGTQSGPSGEAARRAVKPHPLDSAGFTPESQSVVDMDTVTAVPTAPLLASVSEMAEAAQVWPSAGGDASGEDELKFPEEFSDRLITSDLKPD